MPPRDRDRLEHMVKAARRAVEIVASRGRDALAQDEDLLLLVSKLVEIVGEAAKNVSEATRALGPSIPWSAVARTRDRLAHGYFEIDAKILGDIAAADLPAILPDLERLLGQLAPPPSAERPEKA